MKAFYLQIQGGARAIYAYCLIEYSRDNRLDLTKTENIAKAMNLSRTMAFNIEKEFIDRGLTKKVGKSYHILDPVGIKEYYEHYFYMD